MDSSFPHSPLCSSLPQAHGPGHHKKEHRDGFDTDHRRVPEGHHADVSERGHVQQHGSRRVPHGPGDAARRHGADPTVSRHAAHHGDIRVWYQRQEPEGP